MFSFFFKNFKKTGFIELLTLRNRNHSQKNIRGGHMKKYLLVLLLTGLVVTMISGCAATDSGSPAHAEKQGKKVTISTGDFFEACDKFPLGATVEYSFTSTKPVLFNVHYHDKRTKVYPVEEQLTEEVSGSFVVDSKAIYCCMWENKNPKYLKLTYEMKVKE